MNRHHPLFFLLVPLSMAAAVLCGLALLAEVARSLIFGAPLLPVRIALLFIVGGLLLLLAIVAGYRARFSPTAGQSRICRHCGYNLHMIDSRQCPE